MIDKVLKHYLEFGVYTNPGLYKDKLKNDLPDNVKAFGLLVRKSIIHRVTLINGNKFSNTDLRYGDMTKIPWHRQAEDDNLVTVPAIVAELYRRDERGFVMDRREKDKLILTCRFVAILMASILKSKGIPSRVRSGFDPYATPIKDKACDHWITQYWNKNEKRWITIDVDCSLEAISFDPYDMPDNTFIFSPDAWLHVRDGTQKGNYYWNAAPYEGLIVVAWELFYDFHCLMNSEIIYLHSPAMVRRGEFEKLSEVQLKEIDELAKLMQKPDDNFDKLQEIWETKKEYRLLKGALL